MACVVSLGIGVYYMLPDDYENLAQSVVASSAFAQNILGAFLSGGYWAPVNDYRPLMHFWYVGILMQCYIVYPLMLIGFNKLFKLFIPSVANSKKSYGVILGGIVVVSLLLYLLPKFDIPGIVGRVTQSKFYFIQYRLFEIAIGGLISFVVLNKLRISPPLFYLFVTCWLLIISINVIDTNIVNNTVKVIIISCLVAGFVYLSEILITGDSKSNFLYKALALCGTASYSVFVWHQGVFAWYRYIVNGGELSVTECAGLLLVVVVVSVASFLLLEKPLLKYKTKNAKRIIVACTFAVVLLVGSYSFYIYSIAGVIRDVPELGFKKGEGKVGMNIAYCDRIYKMDKDFTSTNKKKVLVIGDSFGRDMANVLLESQYADSIEVSYIYFINLNEEKRDKYIPRIEYADIIFVRGMMLDRMAEPFKSAIKQNEHVYGIGNKRYGRCNGNVYGKRNSAEYFSLRQPIGQKDLDQYEVEKKYWGDKYIDFIAPLVDENNTMPVFSDDKRFISSDCVHLTKDGAIYYAKIFDLGKVLGFE